MFLKLFHLLKLILIISKFIFIFTNVYAEEQSLNIKKVNYANILMYHRFGETTHPSTNIKLQQFINHIDELNREEYHVLNLNKIVKAIKNEEQIPDRSVAITIDDAYLSVYENAWPILKKNGFTFTLFVSTDVIDQRLKNYMNWDQIRELMDHGVTIGSQTKTHPHMHRLSKEEKINEINHSNSRFINELGFKPNLFAYPYGEYDIETIEVIKESDFVAAFGQHSGVAHFSAGLFELPRFAMNENYGGFDRLKLAINALPLEVIDVSPRNPLLTQNPPNFGFTLTKNNSPQKIVRCFASDKIGTKTTRIGRSRIEVRMNRSFHRARGRINCTMEASNGRWRWFGNQFLTK